MNISEAVQVFILIYILVIAALFLTSRFWSPLFTKFKQALGFAPTASVQPPVGTPIAPVVTTYRPGAPRPPKLRPPPMLVLDDPEVRNAYFRRLVECAKVVSFVSASNPTGFPTGLFREWLSARYVGGPDAPFVDVEHLMASSGESLSASLAEFEALADGLSAQASYDELSDLMHFCGEAFPSAKAGSPIRAAVEVLADRLAVASPAASAGQSAPDEHDRQQLERKLEVDFLADVPAKVAHLRRMHAFFRGRLIALRDDATADRRAERMSDCRRHMEEHEKLLAWLGTSV